MGIRGRHISPETRAALARAIVEKTYGTATKAADALGVAKETAYRLKAELLSLGLAAMEAGGPAPEPAPEERHDAAFWRKKAQGLERERDRLSALVRELGKLDGLTRRAPPWSPGPAAPGAQGSATLIVHTSDWHIGEVVRPEEINGWNAYDLGVARKRVERLARAARDIGRRWTSDTSVDGFLLTMGGDAISGDIHDELMQTNELESLPQVMAAVDLYCGLLRSLLDEYGRGHVMAVPGNHGRTTRKPHAKRYGALSYDTHIAALVAREFRDDRRVSFQIAAGPDALSLIYGRRVLLTHGDKIGTGGGKGFAGPVLPILRGTKQVQVQWADLEQRPDLILMGHYHTSAALPGVLANGSLIGLSEFGYGIRGKPDVPKQWLAVMHSRWGLRDRLDVQLEDPPQPDKPRVRASAEAVRG